MGKPLIKKHADNGRIQRGHETPGKLLMFQQQAEWQSRHEGIVILGELILWTASPSGLSQQGCKTSQASCLIYSKPTAVMANKGTRH
jgi:hypothetical protein